MSVVASRSWRLADVDPDVLHRAMQCRVTHEEAPGVYAVTSASVPGEVHWVNLEDVECPVCDCEDHAARERLCRHALAALLYEGDPRVTRLLGRLVRRAWMAHTLILGITREPLG